MTKRTVHIVRAILSPSIERLLIVGSACFVLVAAGCSKSSSTGPTEPLTQRQLLDLGWKDYEAQRYDAAVKDFTDVYTQATTPDVRGEALSGRGWSYAGKRDMVNAKGDFVFAAGITGITPAVLNDVYAGGAFVLYAMNDFSTAATYASTVLSGAPAYNFLHNPKATSTRLRLLLAQSYYANGQFTQTAAQLDILDPAQAPHAGDPTSLLAGITWLLASL